MVMHDREIFRQWYEATVLSRLNNRRPSESWRAPSAYKQITCLSAHARASMRLAHKQALCNSSLDMQEEHVAFYTFSWKLHGWFQVYDSNSFSIFCSCSHSVPCQLPTPLLHAPPSRRCTSCGKTASSRGTQCRWLRKVAEPSVARSCLLWVNGTFGWKNNL